MKSFESFELDGQSLAFLRRLHKLEQSELAAALNVSQALISYYESGTVRISPERQQQLIEHFLELPQPVELLRGMQNLLRFIREGGEEIGEEEKAEKSGSNIYVD